MVFKCKLHICVKNGKIDTGYWDVHKNESFFARFIANNSDIAVTLGMGE